jgi:predicted RecB family nuclease
VLQTFVSKHEQIKIDGKTFTLTSLKLLQIQRLREIQENFQKDSTWQEYIRSTTELIAEAASVSYEELAAVLTIDSWQLVLQELMVLSDMIVRPGDAKPGEAKPVAQGPVLVGTTSTAS